MNQSTSPIIGIDLGTTNSVVAALVDGKIQVIEEQGESILPSVVGLTLDNKLIVGQTAKNQLAAFPERTISSVKRKMGEAVKVKLADQEFSPQEISAILLRRLRQRAETALGREVTRAVITVPAFFDENQRQATREAGQLAGLTVERIINEPTAASLVYHVGDAARRHLIVYDLGGGTFDVSIVRVEEGVVEVLSSKGDTQLGGDDFDQILTKHVADIFLTEHNHDLMAHSQTRWRLIAACERAKCELSTHGVTRIAEEFIATVDGQPVNLDVEIARGEYEALIAPLVEQTIACVDQAIRDSGLMISQLDELILVGGSTRTPLVQKRLREEFQRDPQWSVNPDLAVALGAATQAAMQDGQSVGPVLIDVATHTLGVEAVSGSGYNSELRFVPILRRNSPLPAKYDDVFYTMSDDQEVVNVGVYQGESEQLSRNRLIGKFKLEGLNKADNTDGEILVQFELTLDGTLKVTASERKTGISTVLKIDNALSQMGQQAGDDWANRLEEMFEDSDEIVGFRGSTAEDDATEVTDFLSVDATPENIQRVDTADAPVSKLTQLVSRARSLATALNQDDAQDVQRLLHSITQAEQQADNDALVALESELDDLLFYLDE